MERWRDPRIFWVGDRIGTHHASTALIDRITMKTLLRHASTGKYFQSLDKWTPEREQAHDFGIVRRAIKFAQKMRISDLELILSFDEPQSLGSTAFGDFIRKAMRRPRNRSLRFGRRTAVAAPRWRALAV